MKHNVLARALAAFILCLNLRTVAADEPNKASQAPAEIVHEFIARYCVKCHAGAEPEAELNLEQLSLTTGKGSDQKLWLGVLRRVQSGEMPPENEPHPTTQETIMFSHALRTAMDAQERQRRDENGRVALRRLNRTEYENTLRDLLGVSISVQDMLPIDSSANGFDNNSEALHTSSFLLDRYLEAADLALSAAIANQPQPPLTHDHYDVRTERHVQTTEEKVFRHLNDGLVCFSSSPWQAITLSQFYPPDRGKYRFRISASAYQTAQPVAFRVDAGPMLMGQKNHLVGYFDVAPGAPTVIEFTDDLEARSTIRLLPYGLATAQAVHMIGADKYEGAGLLVHGIEVEGPLHDAWPPESHQRLFGDLPQEKVPANNYVERFEVVSSEPMADAERILRTFCRRAFRRDVTDADVQPLLTLVQERLTDGYSFEQAVRVGLKGALVSPEFLFLREQPGKLDDFALASRLSYFLWSSMPDDQLLDLAATNALSNEGVLQAQVERMLDDSKAKALSKNFLGQWLRLREIELTAPDPRLYPEFDELLQVAMLEEAEMFFEELLRTDASLTNLVASDFTMLNQRLASHYQIPGVVGLEMRKVSLPEASHRGGVLTMASVLKVTANGTTTSPIVRGAFVLDRILNTPPPPPLDGVSAVEPDIRGATTIREQLAKHREISTCASCHAQMDPFGFALESFDVIGGYRDYYRSVGNGDVVTINGRDMPYYKGPAVDSADVLADGRHFANVDELKQLLISDKDQLARAVASKLLTYATGRAPDSLDEQDVNAIVQRLQTKNYGLRSLIHEIVASETFQSK